jgi:hypothetical protein
MSGDLRKVIILDDQDGPQFFYEDEIRVRLDNPARIIKCRSLQSIEAAVERSLRGEIQIVAVIADIEVYDRDKDAHPTKVAGICAAEVLIKDMLRTCGAVYGPLKPPIIFNYIICSRYLESAEISNALRGVERNLGVWLPHKLERPVGLDEFRVTIDKTFARLGIASESCSFY